MLLLLLLFINEKVRQGNHTYQLKKIVHIQCTAARCHQLHAFSFDSCNSLQVISVTDHLNNQTNMNMYIFDLPTLGQFVDHYKLPIKKFLKKFLSVNLILSSTLPWVPRAAGLQCDTTEGRQPVCNDGSGGDNSGLRGSRVLQSPVAHSWLQGCGRLYTVWAGNLGMERKFHWQKSFIERILSKILQEFLSH